MKGKNMKTRAKIFTLIISFIMLASIIAVIPAGAATVDSNYSKVTEASLCLNSYSLADEIENSIPGSTITLEADVSLTEPLVIGEDQLPHYPMEPAEFADICSQCKDMGATLLGGCCGTTPEHIRALSEKLG